MKPTPGHKMKVAILCSLCYSEIVFDSFEELKAEMVEQYEGGDTLDLSTFLCVYCLNDTQYHGIDMDDDQLWDFSA